ncbi:MAG: adenylosuccinate synthetase [Actinomycetota bacterium]|nr:adenylosuccinate synthetase [Actinomycetota bacterium]
MSARDQSTSPAIVAISGHVGSGKSTLGAELASRYGALHLRTQELMRTVAEERGDSLPNERGALQRYGEQLDVETAGQWVSREVADILTADGDHPLVVVDSVRQLSQVSSLREAFPGRIIHIHLTAPLQVLEERYEQRRKTSSMQELATYSAVAADEIEKNVETLENDADVAIDTDRCTHLDVLTRAAAALHLLPSRRDRLVDVLIGGQYGSEGKGNIAYYIAPGYDVLMRVGGPNAGHKVPTEPAYTHRLLPSGTLANPQALLLIGPGATLDIAQLQEEIAHCGVESGRLIIDRQAMIIEPQDKISEQSVVAEIGSTGQGGGAAAARRIVGRSSASTPPVRLAHQVTELAAFIGSTADALQAAYSKNQRVLLEGTQGTSLSIFHGIYPHVTSRDTTTAGTLAEAGIAPHRVDRVIVVVRAYPIRVGNPTNTDAEETGQSGWMGQEISWELVAERSGSDLEALVGAEVGSVTARKRRVAEFDWHQLSRAAEINGATDIALTFADYIDVANTRARRYDQLTPQTLQFIEGIERVTQAPVTLIATRFDPRSVIDRRDWTR